MIDRITPTRRPDEKIAGRQQWRSLLFMHWPIDPQVASRLLPAELELDLLDGTVHVGVVPFKMQGVAPWPWWPRAAAFRFLEANVRLYVLHNGEPGVYFVSLDAASRLAVFAARRLWSLPYFHASMSMRQQDQRVEYRVARGSGPRHRVEYRIGDPLGDSQPGSPEFFFLERYLLFVERRGTIWRGQVHHHPYPAHAAEVVAVEDQLVSTAGLGACEGLPQFAHYSPGVDVDIFGLRAAARRPA